MQRWISEPLSWDTSPWKRCEGKFLLGSKPLLGHPVLSYGYLDFWEIPVTAILRKAWLYNCCLTQHIIVHRIAHQGFDRCSCIPSIPSFTTCKLNPPITSLCQTAATSCLRDSMITQRSWIASVSIYLSSIKTQDNHTLFQVLSFGELVGKRCKLTLFGSVPCRILCQAYVHVCMGHGLVIRFLRLETAKLELEVIHISP